MEIRGTGSGPAQRPPSEWERRPLEMTREPDQGPMKTSRPTSRDHVPGAAEGRDYSTSVIMARPGMIAQRAQAPIPQEVQDMLADGPGGFAEQHFAGGSFDAEKSKPGDDGNVAIGEQGGYEFAKGSASKTTGSPKMGGTAGKGMI